MDVIGDVDDMVDNTTPTDSKTPFEVLKSKMIDSYGSNWNQLVFSFKYFI